MEGGHRRERSEKTNGFSCTYGLSKYDSYCVLEMPAVIGVALVRDAVLQRVP